MYTMAIIKILIFVKLICISLFTMSSMICLLLIPKFYAPQYENDVQSIARMNRLLLRIHSIDQVTVKSRYLRLQKQILIWSLRFLQLPQDQTVVWHITFIYILALLTLPWFRADFIPSGETNAERYGIFYMWGMVFGNEWVPIADTWLFATEQIVLDIFVFFFLVVWRGTDASDLTCRGIKQCDVKGAVNTPTNQFRRQLNEMAWFKGLEIVYWLWRSSELVALSSFYGGIWPTLVQNILVYWMLFVGYILGWGKNGIFTKKKPRNRYISIVEGCVSCQQQQQELYESKTAEISLVEDEKKTEHHTLQYNSSTSITATTLTQEEEQQKIGFISISGSSSSSNSSTPFDSSPYIKSRKRHALKI